ncbi:response regulator transcription factor [Sulfurimonas marina]|uniref:Response regulator transcription factor n=1 Tax=Sulfurimonas marina TaxID=2590551 RepID=A0A7M3V9D7_9BACT|nr:response regulator transcription factor [Sulfurimonas marina]QOP40370.1 response regulator transcription factor [Sulfurimonas marina]
MKILLLEDEYMLSRSIRTYLLNKGYFVDHFDNGIDVMEAVKSQEYDFYVLDINTPLMSGLECLKEISQLHPNTPKIIISAYHDIDSITEAFDLGCSDYLKKPFNLKELELRIDRLTSQVLAKKEVEQSAVVKLSKDYTFDTQTNLLYYKSEVQKFTKREYALLVLFISNRGQIIPDESIRSFIWDGENVENSTIRSLVNRLRSKLHVDIIENVRGFGYIMKKGDDV